MNETFSGKYLECVTIGREDNEQKLILMEDHVEQASSKMIGVHIFCFFALLISKAIAAYTKKTFIHNLLIMATVPAYQFGVFKTYYEVTLQERLATELECTGIPWSQRRAWLYIEISAFAVNIVQFMVGLAKAIKPCGGGMCCSNDRQKPFWLEIVLNENYNSHLENLAQKIIHIVMTAKKTSRNFETDVSSAVERTK